MRTGRNPFGVYGTFPRRFPRVARSSQPWALGRNPLGIRPPGIHAPWDSFPPGFTPRWDSLALSIPNISLVKLDVVFSQQRPQLMLERHFAMMLFLRRNVLLHLLEVRLTHRKICVTPLPLEGVKIPMLFLAPKTRDPFQLLYPIGLRDCAPEAAQQMHVIFGTANDDRRTVQFIGNPAEIRVQIFTSLLLAKPRPAF